MITGLEGRKNSVRKEDAVNDDASRLAMGLKMMVKGTACMKRRFEDCGLRCDGGVVEVEVAVASSAISGSEQSRRAQPPNTPHRRSSVPEKE
jgi:hypothetical protein